jgi:hypothetical protein
MHTGLRVAVLVSVLTFTLVAASGEASARDRFLGVGWGGAWGVQIDKGMENVPGVGFKEYFAFDANFEFRFFVANEFSIDFNFDIGETIRMREDWLSGSTAGNVGAFKVFAHFWVPQGDGKFFAPAPFIGFRGVDFGGISNLTIFEIGSRIGGEVYVTEELTMGFYGRPSFHVATGSTSFWGTSTSSSNPGFEAVFEMTWTIHLPVPRPE